MAALWSTSWLTADYSIASLPLALLLNKAESYVASMSHPATPLLEFRSVLNELIRRAKLMDHELQQTKSRLAGLGKRHASDPLMHSNVDKGTLHGNSYSNPISIAPVDRDARTFDSATVQHSPETREHRGIVQQFRRRQPMIMVPREGPGGYDVYVRSGYEIIPLRASVQGDAPSPFGTQRHEASRMWPQNDSFGHAPGGPAQTFPQPSARDESTLRQRNLRCPGVIGAPRVRQRLDVQTPDHHPNRQGIGAEHTVLFDGNSSLSFPQTHPRGSAQHKPTKYTLQCLGSSHSSGTLNPKTSGPAVPGKEFDQSRPRSVTKADDKNRPVKYEAELPAFSPSAIKRGPARQTTAQSKHEESVPPIRPTPSAFPTPSALVPASATSSKTSDCQCRKTALDTCGRHLSNEDSAPPLGCTEAHRFGPGFWKSDRIADGGLDDQSPSQLRLPSPSPALSVPKTWATVVMEASGGTKLGDMRGDG